MKVDLVRIGNSRGIRIPKALLEQCGFGDTVDLRVEGDHLVLAPGRSPRQGWVEAFRNTAAKDNEELLIDDALDNEFDRDEWQW